MRRSATAPQARRRVVLLAAALLLTGRPATLVSSAEPERFTCPARSFAGSVERDPEGGLRAALERSEGRVLGISTVATPKVPGYAGILAGAVSGEEGEEGDLGGLVPLLRCAEPDPCLGLPLRFPGARSVRVRASIDLAGFDGDIVIGGEEGPLESMPRACPRRPALIVEVLDGPGDGSDALVMIVALSTADLRVIHSERSHVGPEGDSTVVALRFRGTRGGSPSDLVVLRRRRSAQTGGRPIVEEGLFNYVDGRYRSAP